MTLHHSGDLRLVRFNRAFFKANKTKGSFRLDFYQQEGRLFFRQEDSGEYLVKPTQVAFIYGFNAVSIHRLSESLFGIKPTLTMFNLVRVEIDGVKYWEVLKPKK